MTRGPVQPRLSRTCSTFAGRGRWGISSALTTMTSRLSIPIGSHYRGTRMTNKVALAIAGNSEKKATDRVKAIESTEAGTYETADLDSLAAVVVDAGAALSVRRAALHQLLLAQFANPTFSKWRRKFI